MEEKTGEIIFFLMRNAKFSTRRLWLLTVAYLSCEWKCRVGGAVQEAGPCVCSISGGTRSIAGLSGTTDLPDCPSGGNHAPSEHCACILSHFSLVQFFATPWSVAHHSPLSMEWVVISFSRGSSWPRNQASVSYISCIGR